MLVLLLLLQAYYGDSRKTLSAPHATRQQAANSLV
jgi:hypothetical protein